ncbi:hypothetical protein JXA80_08820 [bacterium]|nr:hypothetical protein [candidate division CSSED10-310 bacterium]
MIRDWLVFLIAVLAIGVTATTFGNADPFPGGWRDVSAGILDLDLVTLDIDASGNRILAASNRTVYLSENRGRTWRMVLRLYPGVSEQQLETAPDSVPEPEIEREFDRSEYDEDELYREGILEEEEELDDIDDDDLMRRLEDAGWLDPNESASEAVRTPEPADDIDRIATPSEQPAVQVRWDPTHGLAAYLATRDGVYRTTDGGNTWTLVPTGAMTSGSAVTGIVVLPPDGEILAGTRDGLRISIDYGVSYHAVPELYSERPFRDLERDTMLDRTAIGVTDDGVFILDTMGIARTISLMSGILPQDIRAVAMEKATAVCLAGDQRVMLKQEDDASWRILFPGALADTTIRDLVLSREWLAVATSRGVYLWHRISETGRFLTPGLTELDIRDVVVNPADPSEIWVATASGVFRTIFTDDPDFDHITMSSFVAEFPAIDNVLQAAMMFAEIDLSRDRSWNQDVRKRWFMPWMTLDFSYTDIRQEGLLRSDVMNISSGVPYIGPEDALYVGIERDRFDAYVLLLWFPELAVFDNDMLKIRHRLGQEIQRRNRLVDDVRLAYSNYILEATRQPADDDRVVRQIDHHLRMQQLRASLDALTGFVFEEMAPP